MIRLELLLVYSVAQNPTSLYNHSMKFKLAFIIIILLGFGLRLYTLTATDAWLDEAFSGIFVSQSWTELFHLVSQDVHPFLYFVLLKLWAYLFGSNLYALRFFSLLFGMAILPLTYAVMKRCFNNQRLALLTMGLVAINPFLVDYAVEARSYALVCMLGLASVWFLVRALQQPLHYNRYWCGFSICIALNFLTHLFTVFFSITLLLFALWFYRQTIKHTLAVLAMSSVPLLLGIMSWLPIILFYRKAGKGGFWIPAVDITILPLSVYRYCFGVYRQMHGVPLERLFTMWLSPSTIGLIILISFVGLLFWKSQKTRYDALITFAWLLPLLAAISANYTGRSIYVERFFILSSVFLMMHISILLSRLPQIARIILLLGYSTAVTIVFTTTFRIHHYVTAQLDPHQIIYTDPSQFIIARYYFRNQTFPGKLMAEGFTTLDEAYAYYEPWLVIPKDRIVLTSNLNQ